MTASAPSAAETLERLRENARATWSAGDYDAVAEGIWEVGEIVVRRAGVREGEAVLDVACGTGNAAIRAGLAGGQVVAVDITPELFEAGRRRADEAGVEIAWVEGDAEALPFDDASFDVVLSTFGVMFAPRHEVAAREVVRVLRPGGRLALATWTPEGSVGKLFATVGRHLPPMPEIAAPPILWGIEDHVRALFAGSGIEPRFERRRIELDPDIDRTQAIEFYLASFGPIVKARELLEPQGRWPAMEDDLRPAIDHMLREPPEYLVVTGTRNT